MKMAHKIGAVVLIIILAFIVSREVSKTDKKPDNQPEATFVLLDYKTVKCTVTKFVYEYEDEEKAVAPLFENMGKHSYKISTGNTNAQLFFDQGFKLTYGFNHAEAHRSFMEAARLDPDCAMAYWGQAYALGPNINDPFPDDERKQNAWKALQKAMKAMGSASQKEKDLIEALGNRYAEDTSKPQSELNDAYAAAMTKVVANYPGDADIQTLYAASIMNQMPWNYWDKEGNPNPGIADAKAALEKAIEINPDHPGAHHYYIHMVELPKPDLGVPSADRLGKLIPAAGHLVHMPSHIYIRVGRYADAVQSNADAVAADEDYISQCYAQGMYPLGYYPHNIHFLWSAASLMGDSQTAIAAAKKTAEKVPIGELENMPFLQDFASTPLLAYLRFGQWNEILTIPYPNAGQHMKMIWHYTRAIAFARKNNIVEAEEEVAALDEMLNDESLKSLMSNFNNNAYDIALVAHRAAAGEVAAASGNLDKAVQLLREGVEFEDALVYNEPAAWHIPVRQTLGAVLLKADKATEAEQIYRDDLAINRDNGWSLKGLQNSLTKQGKKKEATEAKSKFDKVWAKADIKIESSVL